VLEPASEQTALPAVRTSFAEAAPDSCHRAT
jgi:hypothetical protein